MKNKLKKGKLVVPWKHAQGRINNKMFWWLKMKSKVDYVTVFIINPSILVFSKRHGMQEAHYDGNNVKINLLHNGAENKRLLCQQEWVPLCNDTVTRLVTWGLGSCQFPLFPAISKKCCK